MTTSTPRPISAADAYLRLVQGNHRFTNNVRSIDALVAQSRRGALVAGQSPMAVVLSCSDSRVPSEIVFDCGLGDLFVVRVAGNVVAPSLVGSIEFATATFGTQLVVVMGHTHCGAVKATVDAVCSGGAPASENLRDIVERISPAVRPLVQGGRAPHALLHEATRANVLVSAAHLRTASRVLEQRVRDGNLVILGAEYDLESGRVDFFDGVPQQWRVSSARTEAIGVQVN
ncbi:MAG: carbonic anhydrase [Myxococcota bacterium]